MLAGCDGTEKKGQAGLWQSRQGIDPGAGEIARKAYAPIEWLFFRFGRNHEQANIEESPCIAGLLNAGEEVPAGLHAGDELGCGAIGVGAAEAESGNIGMLGDDLAARRIDGDDHAANRMAQHPVGRRCSTALGGSGEQGALGNGDKEGPQTAAGAAGGVGGDRDDIAVASGEIANDREAGLAAESAD